MEEKSPGGVSRKDFLEYQLLNEDREYLNHTYQYEQEMAEYVRTGDVEKVAANLEGDVFPEYPEIFGTDSRRNEEYMAVITVALVARKAIEGGVTSGDCFQLSDLYLQKISRAHSSSDIVRIRNEAVMTFTKMVHEFGSSGKPGMNVEDARRFIDANICKKISAKDAAAELHLNTVYLERIFREAAGITIGDYIREGKVERAKHLLVYSDRSILEISNYLSFSSQSHFGNVFRKVTGQTPRQYRDQNRVSNF